jgi:hypothetical protein
MGIAFTAVVSIDGRSANITARNSNGFGQITAVGDMTIVEVEEAIRQFKNIADTMNQRSKVATEGLLRTKRLALATVQMEAEKQAQRIQKLKAEIEALTS